MTDSDPDPLQRTRELSATDFGPDACELDFRSLPPPSQIDRYHIVKELGHGGYGIVYLAYDEKLERQVAIKLPHQKFVSRPEAAAAYLTEARTVANLDHPHIVPVYDVGETDEYPCFIVSKFINGSDLAAKLKQTRFSNAKTAGLIATVADALDYAHQQGLVHRDVPEEDTWRSF